MSNDIDLDSRRTLSSSLLRSLGFSAARNTNSIAWVEIDGSTTLAQREQALQFFKNYASTSMRVAKDEAVAAQLV